MENQNKFQPEQGGGVRVIVIMTILVILVLAGLKLAIG